MIFGKTMCEVFKKWPLASLHLPMKNVEAKKNPVKTGLLLFLLLLPLNINAHNDDALQQLLAPFSNTQHIKIAYEEKRFSLFLKKARLYKGYIEYIAPDTFIKTVKSPDRKKIIIVQSQLTLYQYDSKSASETPIIKKVALNDYPQFKQFKALFSGLFKGQASALTPYYRYEIHSLEDKQTRLTLTSLVRDPFTQSEQQTSHKNQIIEIIFYNEHITNIIMTGLGGERSELSFGENLLEKQSKKIIKQ